ncbi:hypothetical protein [Burkholderia multivorans]|uniref:hypothetical protein n=1 Tax=Burkholderia multivorans TaxID=87883 RepID=UPI001C612418|nr:hypothetical protein [Burkholderia multivorans]
MVMHRRVQRNATDDSLAVISGVMSYLGARLMRLIVELNGVDPTTGEDVCLSKCEAGEYGHDFLLHKINPVLDEGAARYGGRLDSLRALHVELAVSISSDDESFRPAFSLDARTISKLSAAGAAFDFDPYV